MKILVYSYFPLHDNLQLGGAQLMMHDIIVGLVQAGIDITFICPETNERNLISLGKKIKILPVLKIVENRVLFPYENFHNLQQIKRYSQNVDVIWTLDRSFPLEVPQPVVLSLDQFSYPDEMESLFSFTWDVLIVSSQYLYDIADSIAGPKFWVGKPPIIKAVPYCIDTNLFSSTDPGDLYIGLGLSRSSFHLLFPHRPDPAKGFDLALAVLKKLRLKGEPYELLIPMNPAYKSDRRYYNLLRSKAEKMGIASHVVFHDWISLKDLPAYYSLGDYTLAIGTFPEGFGLTPIQSISCGTPVICTRAGAQGDHLPPGHGIRYVNFNDTDEIVYNIINKPSKSEIIRGRAFVEKHYVLDLLIKRYLECFAASCKKDALYNPLGRSNSLRVSPWCHMINDSTLWHDYRMRKYDLTKREVELIKMIGDGSTFSTVVEYTPQIIKLIYRGILLGDINALRECSRKRKPRN
jgi:glycosyltransferase involved in cell wall biosynthesis